MSAAAAGADGRPASWFQRFFLPGFALKGVIIGGGYATGRELAEFFLPAGPWGGLAGMLLATLIWSGITALTFLFARSVGAYDYRRFFGELLGRGWIVFEICYLLFLTLILAVFGAAAGEIGAAMFGFPVLVGTLALCGAIALFVAFGNASVELLFKYASIMLYSVYALFLVLTVANFGDRIAFSFDSLPSSGNWVGGGITYASYNIVGAVVILPLIRHLTSSRDAVVAGVIAGPLAMAPAIIFYISMCAFLPAIADEKLPSDMILQALGSPVFHLLFQSMIFLALLESGVGGVHAINERISGVWEKRGKGQLGTPARVLIASLILLGCVFVAQSFGLVALIANGYRALAYMFLATFLLPLLTLGVWRLWRRPPAGLNPGDA